MLNKGIFDEYEKCLQDEPAATTARCPVHIDVPGFCAEMAKGEFAAAYAVLQKRMPFAGIFCLVCEAPCEQACVRKTLDAPVRVSELERAAVRYGRAPLKKKFKTARRKGNAAVVGGGISGLAAAYDLDRRGLTVTLFEKSRRLGGWLWELASHRLEAADIEQELQSVSELAVEVLYGQDVDPQLLSRLQNEYDVVFLGTGAWDRPLAVDPATFRAGSENLFAGGSLAGTRESIIEAVSSGKRAAVTMERYVKKVSLTAEREREAGFETRLVMNLEYALPSEAVEKGCGGNYGDVGANTFYTREEAQREAARCLLCECDECIKACAHMQRYGRKPKTYAREIYTNENVFLGTRYANKMINSCTLCGLCGERCPLNLSMAPLVSQTRRSMVNSDKMPPSAHDFALRDMAFSNSGLCALVRQPPGQPSERAPIEIEGVAKAANAAKAAYLFFPGCQLAASAPEHIEAAYAWLRVALPEGVALALGCCGAPADWAGQDDLLNEAVAGFRCLWEDEGRPTMILACSSCMDVFGRHLPEIPLISLWQVIDERWDDSPVLNVHDAVEVQGLPQEPRPSSPGEAILNVHDACTSRYDPQLQKSVRHIAGKLGYEIEELRYSGKDTKCCGYGGLVFYANREQEGDFAVDRAKESPHDLLVYCAMCKDLFTDAGKRCFHLLDLLFADDIEAYALKRAPTISERQANRVGLKRKLLREVWNEGAAAPDTGTGTSADPGAGVSARLVDGKKVNIAPEILALMDERLILVTDVEDALARAAAEPDERFYNKPDDSYLISARKQYMTYWVRYAQSREAIEVTGVYSHRMEIIE